MRIQVLINIDEQNSIWTIKYRKNIVVVKSPAKELMVKDMESLPRGKEQIFNAFKIYVEQNVLPEQFTIIKGDKKVIKKILNHRKKLEKRYRVDRISIDDILYYIKLILPFISLALALTGFIMALIGFHCG